MLVKRRPLMTPKRVLKRVLKTDGGPDPGMMSRAGARAPLLRAAGRLRQGRALRGEHR